MRKLLFLGFVLILLFWGCATLGKWFNPVPIDKLRKGQTVEDVREFCRFPNRKNTTVVNGVRHEQWVYDLDYKIVYLYFEDRILVAWQY